VAVVALVRGAYPFCGIFFVTDLTFHVKNILRGWGFFFFLMVHLRLFFHLIPKTPSSQRVADDYLFNRTFPLAKEAYMAATHMKPKIRKANRTLFIKSG
jgi:hypothetical protein